MFKPIFFLSFLNPRNFWQYFRFLYVNEITCNHLQKEDVAFTFCNNEDLLRKKVVVRATNQLNSQRSIVARQVARKMLPVLLILITPIFFSNIPFPVANNNIVKSFEASNRGQYSVYVGSTSLI